MKSGELAKRCEVNIDTFRYYERQGLLLASGIRAMVCARLAWLEVQLCPDANSSNSALVSTPQSHIDVRVVPTDEEAMIARHTLDLIHDDYQDQNE